MGTRTTYSEMSTSSNVFDLRIEVYRGAVVLQLKEQDLTVTRLARVFKVSVIFCIISKPAVSYYFIAVHCHNLVNTLQLLHSHSFSFSSKPNLLYCMYTVYLSAVQSIYTKTQNLMTLHTHQVMARVSLLLAVG